MRDVRHKPISVAAVWGGTFDPCLLIKHMCSIRGFEYQYFSDFATAKEQFRQQPPTVVIVARTLVVVDRALEIHTDDGLTFCADIRADAALSQLPIIVGYADLARRTFDQCYEAGANGCFGRMYDIYGIFTMIERLAEEPTQTHLVDNVYKQGGTYKRLPTRKRPFSYITKIFQLLRRRNRA